MGSNSLGLAPHVVARLRNFMADNLRRPLRVKEMARIACLSEFHFSRQFRIATGESPHRFFNRLRMEQARRLLEHSDLRLAEIAGAVGYRTQASFAMAFRDAYGQPPGRYGRGVRMAFPTAADHPYNLSR